MGVSCIGQAERCSNNSSHRRTVTRPRTCSHGCKTPAIVVQQKRRHASSHPMLQYKGRRSKQRLHTQHLPSTTVTSHHLVPAASSAPRGCGNMHMCLYSQPATSAWLCKQQQTPSATIVGYRKHGHSPQPTGRSCCMSRQGAVMQGAGRMCAAPAVVVLQGCSGCHGTCKSGAILVPDHRC